MQTTSHLLMIRPAAFGFNAETAVNNAFQHQSTDNNVNASAQNEFDDFVAALRLHQIDVTVIDDSVSPHTPDSVFPNNWASFHNDGKVVLYPLFALNRRMEREKGVLSKINEKFVVDATIDLTSYEKEDIFLEGTGSMVLDRDYNIAYACLSPRTHPEAFHNFCTRMGFTPILFTAVDETGLPIYHTNVMMCVAGKYVVICLDSVRDEPEKEVLRETFKKTGKQVIPISYAQMNAFAGNMLQVENTEGEKFLVMSTQAYQSLASDQVTLLESYNQIIHSALNIIEENGGGSARCMMAEIFLPIKFES